MIKMVAEMGYVCGRWLVVKFHFSYLRAGNHKILEFNKTHKEVICFVYIVYIKIIGVTLMERDVREVIGN